MFDKKGTQKETKDEKEKVKRKAPIYLLDIATNYELNIETDPKNRDIDLITFDDGRAYKLQHPGFFEIHEAATDTNGNPDHNLFILGLQHLYSLNEKSPEINEKYLNNNRDEGLYLWSQVIRGLLQGS